MSFFYSLVRVTIFLKGIFMHSFGTGVILLGMTIIILAQIVGAIMVFNVSFLKGVFSLTIPGYFLFVLRREGMYR